MHNVDNMNTSTQHTHGHGAWWKCESGW